MQKQASTTGKHTLEFPDHRFNHQRPVSRRMLEAELYPAAIGKGWSRFESKPDLEVGRDGRAGVLRSRIGGTSSTGRTGEDGALAESAWYHFDVACWHEV